MNTRKVFWNFEFMSNCPDGMMNANSMIILFVVNSSKSDALSAEKIQLDLSYTQKGNNAMQYISRNRWETLLQWIPLLA